MFNKANALLRAVQKALKKEIPVGTENYQILREVVIIGVYANWLVTFVDHLSFSEPILFRGLQWIGVTISLFSFISFFFNLGRWILIPGILNIIGSSMSYIIEIIVTPELGMKLTYFWMFGMIFWTLLFIIELDRVRKTSVSDTME